MRQPDGGHTPHEGQALLNAPLSRSLKASGFSLRSRPGPCVMKPTREAEHVQQDPEQKLWPHLWVR